MNPVSLPLTPAQATQRTLLLLGGVLLFRLLYAAIFPVNPAGDEAYYWDWGRQLDFGYYSKPPFIAWLYAFVDWIGGGSLFAIRATAAVLGAVSLYFLYRLTAELFDARTGWIAVLIGVTAPANSVLSFFLTIDAPLTVCWTAALWMLWRYLYRHGGAGTLTVLFLALAVGHLSKQMMMIFPVLALAFLASRKETHRHLRRLPLLLALLGSYLSLLAPLVWNAQNNWITFRHTAHHFESGTEEGSVIVQRLGDFFSFLATQLGVLGPAIGFILLAVCLVSLKGILRASAPVRYLLFFGALPVAGLLLLALRQPLQPNWAAVFYAAGVALVAAWYAGHLKVPFPPRSWRRLFPIAISLGAAFALYFYFSSPVFSALGKAGHTADPNRRLMGFDRLAEGFEAFREKQPDGHSLFLVTIGHRDLTSHLAFGLPDQPRVYRWESLDQISSQYEVWNDPYEDGLAGNDALILVDGEFLPERFAEGFREVENLGEFEVTFGYDRIRQYSVFRGNGLKLWPKGYSPPRS